MPPASGARLSPLRRAEVGTVVLAALVRNHHGLDVIGEPSSIKAPEKDTLCLCREADRDWLSREFPRSVPFREDSE